MSIFPHANTKTQLENAVSFQYFGNKKIFKKNQFSNFQTSIPLLFQHLTLFK